MAEPPILTLADVSLTFGGDPLFAGVALAVHPSERIALVGRNGSGKSTLMKNMAGLVLPDSGTRFVRPGLSVGYMAQDPDFACYPTLGTYVAEGIDPAEHYRAEMAMEGVKLDGGLDPARASGGERRRAALARILAAAPDLMLLDEPTNHLDIAAVQWLEDHLAATRTAFVVISHDRAFLRRLTDRTLWVDRGIVRRLDQGFSAFEEWRDKTFEEEDQARHKLDRLIKAEGRWAVEGISARRKRNQGRVRRLAEMRAERRAQIARQGTARMEFDSAASRSGKLVVEANSISKSFGGRPIVRDFSLRIQRGERVALVGPNGVGKTTLLKMLTGELAPDTGTVRLGTNLIPAVFDQNRAALDPEASLWDTLTGDAEIGVSGRGDQVMVRSRPRHVVGYLKDFLFAEAQARGPVSALSGGEKARLLLARLMAKDSNLLILDEPTNDLDVETLDLLQELIADYEGTVILVSHDRDFLDRVATTTVAMEGDGRATVYAGGWTDHLAQRGAEPDAAAAARPKTPGATTRPDTRLESRPARLSFKQAHRLDTLPAEIDRLAAEIAKLEGFLADPDLFTRDPAKFQKATEALIQRQTALAAAEEEWLTLEELREAAG
jgi:ATP-binding cassette subfamily F protein uup